MSGVRSRSSVVRCLGWSSALVLLGCAGPGATGSGPTGDGESPPGDGPGAEVGGPAEVPEDAPAKTVCVMACEVAADCCAQGTPGCPGAYPLNWSCEDGLCAYGGCSDDTQCTFGGFVVGNECHPVAGIGTCFAPCTSDADCAAMGGTCSGQADDGARMCALGAGGCASDADCYGMGVCDDDGACSCTSASECTAAPVGAKGWGCGAMPTYSGPEDGGGGTDGPDDPLDPDDPDGPDGPDGPDDACAPGDVACEEARACSPRCEGALPVCLEGTCVACADDDDCSGAASCDIVRHVCGKSCNGERPMLYDGTCVGCWNDGQCPSGETCDQQNHLCTECAACSAPYPACVRLYDDEVSCVACTEDRHCAAGMTCDAVTYTCVEPADPVEPVANDACERDADCDPGDSGYTLECHAGQGLCVAVEGMCDDATGYCVGVDGTVEDCFTALEMFGSPSAIPAGSGPIRGVYQGLCGCSNDNCANGFCMDTALLLGEDPPPGAPAAVCVALER